MGIQIFNIHPRLDTVLLHKPLSPANHALTVPSVSGHHDGLGRVCRHMVNFHAGVPVNVLAIANFRVLGAVHGPHFDFVRFGVKVGDPLPLGGEVAAVRTPGGVVVHEPDGVRGVEHVPIALRGERAHLERLGEERTRVVSQEREGGCRGQQHERTTHQQQSHRHLHLRLQEQSRLMSVTKIEELE
ncbi:hypothetical protein ON010_g10800 [Phytophthora cinnamomi]|nr:hypothetical protein ON010_g10800 [Phytophthora cinnamomi]